MTAWVARIAGDVDRRVLARALSIAFGAGLFLAFLGPFGSAAAPLHLRVSYWLLLSVGGTLMGVATNALVCGLLDPEDRRPFLMAAVTALAMTPPGTLGVYLTTAWMFSVKNLYGPLPAYVAPVLAVSLAMTLVNVLAGRRPVETHASAKGNAPPPRFLDRLPAKLRGADLHAVEAEDHYLRLHTSRGSDLILMRLSDAIAELDGLEGAQTHRSWWVAKQAVQGARRLDGRAVLELPGGVEAPVSRNYARTLKAEGWF